MKTSTVLVLAFALLVIVDEYFCTPQSYGGPTTKRPANLGAPNPKSPHCPHGETYLSECNWCGCGRGCTERGCLRWTCASGLALVADRNCYGTCTCDPVKKIVSCERKGCRT